jgi:NarL family two-component system sensor histidine kinase YdfH
MQQIQQSLQKISLFRWLLFLWIGLIYLWAIRWGGVIKDQIASSDLFLFTLLMLLHLGLYGVSNFLPKTHQWYRLLYFAFQALLILLISRVSQRLGVPVGLYLALLTEMASTLLRIRMAPFLVAACLFLFFSLNFELLREFIPIISLHIILLYIFFFVIPVFLLVGGYAHLVARQTRAHAQTQTLLHDLELAHKQLADYAVRIEELTRAAERRRMARELHDTLAQGLTGLILQLEAVKSHLVNGHDERALEIVTQAMGRARTSLATARSAIDDLRSEAMPPVDMQQALENEIDRFTAASGIPCTADLCSQATAPAAYGESIVRIVAEGLTNVARHAQASQVRVRIAQQDHGLVIEVQDNGTGFDPAAMTQQGHYGLLGLRERARLLGGQFSLTSAPGEGTTLRLLLPIDRSGGAA